MDGELYRLFLEDFERQYALTANFVSGARDGSATEPSLVAAEEDAMGRFLVDAARRFEVLRRVPDSAVAHGLAERLRYQAHVYSTRYLPAFECSYITDQLIVGRNPLTSHDIEWLRIQGVTTILDLREEWEWAAQGRFGAVAVASAETLPGPWPRRHVPIIDDNVAIEHDVLSDAVSYLHDALQMPFDKVYVHCRAGLERTAAVLIAYFAAHESFGSYEETLARLRQRRPGLSPRSEQAQSVRIWLG